MGFHEVNFGVFERKENEEIIVVFGACDFMWLRNALKYFFLHLNKLADLLGFHNFALRFLHLEFSSCLRDFVVKK